MGSPSRLPHPAGQGSSSHTPNSSKLDAPKDPNGLRWSVVSPYPADFRDLMVSRGEALIDPCHSSVVHGTAMNADGAWGREQHHPIPLFSLAKKKTMFK